MYFIAADCDPTKCPAAPKHYVELGCKPVTNDKECCPSRFDCPSPADFDETKCSFNNKTYSKGEKIPGKETDTLCAASCICSGSAYKFNCASVGCPDLHDVKLLNCAKQTKNGACCPDKYICEEEKIKKLSKCYLGGTEYLEGASMYPEGTCMKCECNEHFKNDTIIGNPNCEEINCGTSLRYLSQFRSGCIPTYFKDASCCPYQWRCRKFTFFFLNFLKIYLILNFNYS